MNQKRLSQTEYEYAKLWSPAIAERGYARIPSLLIHYQGQLGITTGEFNVLAQIISFRWTNRDPYPSIGTIARYMGVSPDTVQRHLRSLEKKDLIRRVFRPRQTNEYDLKPLITQLTRYAELNPNPYKSAVKALAELKALGGANLHTQEDAANEDNYVNPEISGGA